MEYDVLVLGCGPAGFYSALSCASCGLRTAVVERGIPGGTGLATGCLPVKMILDRIKLLRDAGYSENLPRVLEEISRKVTEIPSQVLRRLKEASVDLYTGEGAFLSDRCLKIGKTILTARFIVLATGTEPEIVHGLSGHPNIISHTEAVSLSRPPGSLTILGSNVEGIEFASLFSELGSQVMVIEQEDEILPSYDRDLVAPLEDRLRENGVTFRMGSIVIGCRDSEEGLVLDIQGPGRLDGHKNPDESGIPALKGPLLMTGLRRPCLPAGLDATGVSCSQDRIPVDRMLRTNVPHIYAVGDINGILGMGSSAMQQGMQIGDLLSRSRPPSLEQGCLPRAVFSLPEIAGAGLQEQELTALGISYKVGRFELGQTWRGFGQGIGGFVKVLSRGKDDLAGIWMSGPSVSEIAGLCAPLLNGGNGLDGLKRGLMIHPVLGEAVMEAANQITWE